MPAPGSVGWDSRYRLPVPPAGGKEPACDTPAVWEPAPRPASPVEKDRCPGRCLRGTGPRPTTAEDGDGDLVPCTVGEARSSASDEGAPGAAREAGTVLLDELSHNPVREPAIRAVDLLLAVGARATRRARATVLEPLAAT